MESALARADHLAGAKQDGVPAVLMMPGELADLIEIAGEAMAIAAAMQLALGSRDLAVQLLHHVADKIVAMRKHLAEGVTDPALAGRRTQVMLADDAAVLDAAESLRSTQHWTRSRAVCVSSGLIGPGQDDDLEAVAPGMALSFELVEAW